MTYEERLRQEFDPLIGTDEIVRLHLYSNGHSFVTGRLLGYDEEVATLRRVSRDSSGPESIMTVEMKFVIQVMWGSRYFQALRSLQRRGIQPLPEGTDLGSGEGHLGILRSAHEQNLLVSIVTAGGEDRGFVLEIGEGWFALARVSTNDGADEGIRIVPIQSVESIAIGGIVEMGLAFLAREWAIRRQLEL